MARASSFSADLDKLIFQPVDVDIDADSLKDIYKSDQAYVNQIVENILSQVEQKRSLLEDLRRSSPKRKLRTNIQKLATGTQEFLQEFSGIFDIIKGIDSRAGSIAYGTFSLLLTVAKNKQQHEDVITSTLEDLSRWLSRLRAVEKSEYDNDVILKFVLEIYIKVIDFGRHAVLYYGSSSSKRVFQAVVQPAQSVTQKQAGEIRSLIADLMQELLIIQHDHIKKIKCYLEREQQERDKQCVDKLEILFDVSSDFCAKNMIQESNRMFDGMFSKGKPKAVFSRKAPQLEEISLDALSERSEYKSWMANSSSCLLLLEGENYDSYDTSPRLCWLSPVAVQFYQHFDELKNCYVIYHFIDKSSEVGVVRMLKSIVLQLLRENRDICRKLFDRIQYLSTRPATEQENLFEILHHILRTFNQEKAIYIAVAGVEHMFYNTPRRLFGRLLRLITSADVLVTVKILVICRSRYWPNAGYKDRSGLQRALEIGGHEELLLAVFVAFGWKQRSLSNR